VTVMFLAGMAWGGALLFVAFLLFLRAARKQVLLLMVSFFRGAPPEERVRVYDMLFAKFCVHCGTEQTHAPYCLCPQAMAEREGVDKRVQAILTDLARPKP
jgi:hypothetical protein